MKQTSKDKIISESLADKIQHARDLKRQNKCWQAIEAYHKAIFLKQDPQYLIELAEIYENNLDLSSASLFYRRAHQLNSSAFSLERVKSISKIQGIQLLELGSVKNILEDTKFDSFARRYPQFHKKMLKKIAEKSLFSDYLESAMGYLQVNQRQLALSEIENCLMIDERDADLVVLRAMVYWSIFQTAKGYKEFWNAYSLDKTQPEVQLFLEMISPQIQRLFKEAKYDLIEKKVQRCKLKVKEGLQIHPYHTQLLILSAYLHRSKGQYEQALSDLQLANKHIEDLSFEPELRSQISLTYNQMGIFLYKQSKYAEACKLFTEGLTFNPKDWGMLTNRGDCFKALNDFIRALEDFLKAYEIQKKNDDLNFRIASIYSIRGVALFNSKNYDLSLKEFDESLVFSPRCPQFHLSRAKCLLQLGRRQEAVESLQRCLQLDEKQVEASQMLGQLKDPQQRKSKNNRKIIVLSKEK